ncbi:MAG: ABC transporter ATP-binding protein [candidate division KSB1 bacterium]|nr:ABC transporter ATP-binding protein [candidate division KSB1 bacterium]MDZ7356142.1 ABC transporter ATP-binding protein [candidate division KSB1 bacterium]MDZ7398880.1 ABC transporter ATP-binding protein [candidate division KSB1 bacterium]
MITLHEVSKSFGSFVALKDITLEITPGQYWMIIGPNGAGKTTLLKLIATLAKPSQGEIIIQTTSRSAAQLNGPAARNQNQTTGAQQSAKTQPLAIRQQIGFIGHQSFLYNNLTAEENLRFYARMYHLPNAQRQIERTLQLIGLSARRHDLVRTFSRGMQQRLSIGRALLADPKIILLDEPFTGLDQSAIENFVDLFTSLISPDRTIVMTTHDLDLGLKLASHFVILSKGRLVWQGLTREYDPLAFKSLYRRLTEEPS